MRVLLFLAYGLALMTTKCEEPDNPFRYTIENKITNETTIK